MKFSSKLEFYEANYEKALAETEVNDELKRKREKEVQMI